jgi:hypothetical protein
MNRVVKELEEGQEALAKDINETLVRLAAAPAAKLPDVTLELVKLTVMRETSKAILEMVLEQQDIEEGNYD